MFARNGLGTTAVPHLSGFGCLDGELKLGRHQAVFQSWQGSHMAPGL